jgi:hypothetical protein
MCTQLVPIPCQSLMLTLQVVCQHASSQQHTQTHSQLLCPSLTSTICANAQHLLVAPWAGKWLTLPRVEGLQVHNTCKSLGLIFGNVGVSHRTRSRTMLSLCVQSTSDLDWAHRLSIVRSLYSRSAASLTCQCLVGLMHARMQQSLAR